MKRSKFAYQKIQIIVKWLYTIVTLNRNRSHDILSEFIRTTKIIFNLFHVIYILIVLFDPYLNYIPWQKSHNLYNSSRNELTNNKIKMVLLKWVPALKSDSIYFLVGFGNFFIGSYYDIPILQSLTQIFFIYKIIEPVTQHSSTSMTSRLTLANAAKKDDIRRIEVFLRYDESLIGGGVCGTLTTTSAL
ncbi:hypothetical protein GLOIN_2v1616704 [Rhizophagus clarus]|uniref:Uncharacterized protein n=1 Tax=Rhizophagus clarus TaxID=94130 RepID=A0A8H3LJG7_9GLOM|nr:hypothetical protein GLOIN_2v1616704 [Rhizophagus clarus]